MTHLEIVENMITDYYNSEGRSNKFIKLYWNTIEQEIVNWSGSYFDNNICSYLGNFYALNFQAIITQPEPDYYGSPMHAMLGDKWFFGDDFYM
jgi:hypothetical protein